MLTKSLLTPPMLTVTTFFTSVIAKKRAWHFKQLSSIQPFAPSTIKAYDIFYDLKNYIICYEKILCRELLLLKPADCEVLMGHGRGLYPQNTLCPFTGAQQTLKYLGIDQYMVNLYWKVCTPKVGRKRQMVKSLKQWFSVDQPLQLQCYLQAPKTQSKESLSWTTAFFWER